LPFWPEYRLLQTKRLERRDPAVIR
jgi:hypothetical protein